MPKILVVQRAIEELFMFIDFRIDKGAFSDKLLKQLKDLFGEELLIKSKNKQISIFHLENEGYPDKAIKIAIIISQAMPDAWFEANGLIKLFFRRSGIQVNQRSK